MKSTNHINKRMSQRGITGQEIELVYSLGENYLDKVILDRKIINHALKGLHQIERDLAILHQRVFFEEQ